MESFAQRSHLHPPPPPPPPPTNNSNLNIKAPIPISFSNGNSVLKKRRRHHHRRRSQESLYRECLRNHAASLGGHALDGCGEFMPSPSSSLTCAACGCHRNFHRRFPSSSHPFPSSSSSSSSSSSTTSSSDDGEEHEDNLYGHSSSDLHVPSAPSMLMAFLPAAPPPPPPRKRFRTRFSSEQKERMQELSERLGWRLHKRDDKLVEESCREMGVRRGVFKVWMHNNKHNFRPPQPPRRSTSPTVNTAVTPSTATVGL